MIKKIFLNNDIILILIIINSIAIFLEGFDLDPKVQNSLMIIDSTITVLFMIELIVKLSIYGRNYFSSGWNIFDFIIIVVSLPSLISLFTEMGASFFSVFLVFRILRVLKTVRVFRFIPGIDHLILGVMRAVRSTVIILLGFLVSIFLLGIISYHFFHLDSSHFKDPLVSLYSIFKVFTVEGWNTIPEEIAGGKSNIRVFFTYFWFVLILLFGGVIGLSLVNSIFVDAMVSDNTDELEKKIDELNNKVTELISKID